MNLVLSKNFKEAILIHSIDYYYNNGTHDLDSLLPNIRNLKSLTFYNNTSRNINLKSILLPELQEVYLNVGYWSSVLKIHVQNVQWCTLKFWFSILKLLDLHDIFPFLYNFAHRSV